MPVKIINPSRKTAYTVRKLRVKCHFESPNSIKKCLCDAFPQEIPDTDVDLEIGYVNPGHGARGQQRWIVDDNDVQDMYKEYHGRNEVLLWFYIPCSSAGDARFASKKKKRSCSPEPGSNTQKKRRSGYEQKLDEV